MFLFGDNRMTEELRVMTSIELFNNASYYSQHPVFERLVKDGIFKNVATVLLASLSANSYSSNNLSDNLIKTEAIDNCRSKNWSSFLCILGLSSVIGISIQTVYPLQGKSDNCYFKLFSSLINPRTPAIHHDVLNILFYPF